MGLTIRQLYPGLILVIGLLFLNGCGGKGRSISGTPEALVQRNGLVQINDLGTGLTGLTNPNELREVSAVNGPVLNGSDFSPSLSTSNVQTSGEALILSSKGMSLANGGIAYAMWAINTAHIMPGGKIMVEWTGGSETGNLWVGVADYSSNSWCWSNPTSSLASTPFNVNNCISENDVVLVAVVSTGNQIVSLSRLFLTVENSAPELISVSNYEGVVGQNLQIQGINIGSDATSWHWDFGECSEQTTSTEMIPEVALGSEGNYECEVTAFNSQGSSTYNFTMEVHHWDTGLINEMGGKSENIALDGLGRPHIVSISQGQRVTYIHWNGAHWELELATIPVGQSDILPEIAVSFSGQPHILYFNERENNIKYLTKDETGWVEEIVGEAWEDDYICMAIEVDAVGIPHICYSAEETVGSNDFVLKYTSRGAGGWLPENVAIIDNFAPSNSTDLELDFLGRPHIVWVDTQYVKYAYFDGNSWLEEEVANTDWIATNSQIEVTPTGIPMLVFMDDMSCWFADRTGGSWVLQEISESSEIVRYGVGLAVTSTGAPQVVYTYEGSPPPLHPVKRLQREGSTWINLSVPEADPELVYLNIALDNNDQPHLTCTGYNNRGEVTGFHSYIGTGINYAPKGMDVADTILHKDSPVIFEPIYACGSNDYSWDFGGNAQPSVSNERYPQVTMKDTGLHEGSYTVTNEQGSDTFYFQMNVDNWVMEHIEEVDVQTNRFHAVDSAGHPHTCYWAANLNEFHYAYNTGSSWDIEVLATGNSAGYLSDIEVDSNDFPHIIYFEGITKSLFYAYKDGLGWHSELIYEDANIFNYSRFDLELSSLDQPNLVFWDREPSSENQDSDLYFGTRQNGTWEFSKVLTDISLGSYVAMALDSNNVPHITFVTKEDSGMVGNSLNNFSYANLEGASWEVQELYEGYFIHAAPDIEIDSLDRPHIIYDVEVNSNLRNTIHTWFDASSWLLEDVESGEGFKGDFEIDQNDNLHLVRREPTSEIYGNTHYVVKDESGWSGKTICLDAGNTSLELDNTGNPSISVVMQQYGELVYREPFIIFLDQ